VIYNDGNFVFYKLFAESGNGLASEEKKILLERYGYDVDADDYFSESSPKVFQFSLYLFSFYAGTNMERERNKNTQFRKIKQTS
jgi:hypothetical protein